MFPRAAGVARYVIRRLLQFVIVLWVASVIVFVAIYVAGDPVRQILPLGSSKQALDQLRHQLGLDRPVLIQYLDFVRDALHGNFGHSLWLDEPALQAVIDRVPTTAAIVVSATLIGALVGVLLGVIASLRPGKLVDNIVNALSYAFTSIAPFWLGLMLILVVAVHVGSFATFGFGWDASHLVLPIATLAVVPTGRIAQMTRLLMIAESNKQYVMTARAKGLSEIRIALKHQLRNAGLPLVTLIFYDFARMFVGDALLVEVVFGIQGVGGLASTSFANGDIYLSQAAVMVGAVIVASSNLVADLLLLRMDPRTRAAIRPGRRW
jgi:ABC-type dipeptide/oligopeptide/nickel transport system permease component